MLLRPDGDSVIAISQPAHAWLSGQLARAWGNQAFGGFEPREEVCLAAEQHDIGWITWEKAPTLNPDTGLPHDFRATPTGIHVNLWSQAGPFALSYGRYPALLVSLHGAGLYERFGPGPDAPASVREAVAAFLKREAAFQSTLIASLASDERYARYVNHDTLARNRRLIAAWDALSLALCGGLEQPRMVAGVPAGRGEIDLTLTPPRDHPATIAVEPWPFAPDALQLAVEGRRLTGTFSDEREMRAALEQAPWVRIEPRLIRR